MSSTLLLRDTSLNLGGIMPNYHHQWTTSPSPEVSLSLVRALETVHVGCACYDVSEPRRDTKAAPLLFLFGVVFLRKRKGGRLDE
ncbi:hypothetical protein Pyn_34316 [Prunus yedoensis var. nudiflora]|uniref:Uncharacterized protein n=1 Tax=Prunus yedoensis var. nudiflora TaxID=2094558 RepID=A0A315AV74_PRUYE|nr:hypothetical protein Pyn_34316 [Prunus yedoensis var. nudiflora]